LPSHNRNRARKIQSDVDGETPVCLARVHAICSTVAPQGEIDPAEVTGSADTRAGHSHGFTTPLPPRFARSPSPVLRGRIARPAANEVGFGAAVARLSSPAERKARSGGEEPLE
jgi:hypothetical protein